MVPTRKKLSTFAAAGLAICLLLVCMAARAAAPTFQAAGASSSGTGARTVAWPTHAIGDVALLIVETANEAVTLSTPSGFVQVANSPQGTGTVAGGGTRLTVFWARATSTNMASAVVADAGNHVFAQILTFRGVVSTGNPWDVTAGSADATANSTFSVPGATTTVTNTLVVAIVSNAVDSNTAQTSGWTNASLTGLTERADDNDNAGNGGGFGVATGVKATAGAYAATTGNIASSSIQAQLSIALKPNTTTLGDGTNPANVTIAPSAAITDLDVFTFVTSAGTDSVTGLTVTLTGVNAFASLSEVRITSSNNATTYFSAVANPVSNTITFSGGTPIPVSTTLTSFKIRITPKTHANMPVPAGSSYSVGGTVTAYTSTLEKTGTDGASATVTVDNLSPAGATGAGASAGNGNALATLNWTTSVSADFDTTAGSVIYRWASGSAGGEVPAEGSTPTVGSINGTATVACVVASAASTAISRADGSGGSAECTTGALTNGQTYTYKVFQKDSNGNYDLGVVIGSIPIVATTAFNAVETGANATTGALFTKIAGTNFALDIVALNSSNAVATAFTGVVKVELVNNSGGGACASLPLISVLTNQTFVSGDSGRHALTSPNTTANSWPNARIRISYPIISPTVVSCSIDNFAIRPASLVINSVSDLDWTTAGVARPLTNTALAGAVVHKAGRNFTISATAYNGAVTPAITTNYAGNPTATASACAGAGTACTAAFGTVTTPASWSASAGVVTATTASYSDVGAFGLQLQDTTFSAVDATDGSTAAQRNIPLSTKVDVGRFVPDHYAVSFNTPQLTPGCSSFTYVGQVIGYGTAPVMTVTAQNSANATTTNYAGLANGSTIVKFSNAAGVSLNQSPYDTQAGRYARFDALGGGATPAVLVSGLPATTADPVISTFIAGVGTFTFNSGAGLGFIRSATTPNAPFNADITLALNIVDADGVTYASNPARFGSIVAAGNGISFTGANKAMRFGRLQLANVHGSELLTLRVPVEAQYWNGTAFVTNTADSCTTLAAATVTMDDYKAPLTGLAACDTGLSVLSGATLAGGMGALRLSAPGSGKNGSVRLRVNLGAASGNTCLAAGGAQSAAASAAQTYLQVKSGANYDADPTVRAAFGVRRAGPVIYSREMY